MGFPTYIYLSKGFVRDISTEVTLTFNDRERWWSDLFLKEIGLGLSPTITITRENRALLVSRILKEEDWPPRQARSISAGILEYLRKRNEVKGGRELDDQLEHEFYYYLDGRLFWSDSERRVEHYILDPMLRVLLKQPDSSKCYELSLATENLAGLKETGQGWMVQESGVDEMLYCLREGGYPISGLFYLSRPSTGCHAAMRAVFIKSERQRLFSGSAEHTGRRPSN